jgi:hypothetical protein
MYKNPFVSQADAARAAQMMADNSPHVHSGCSAGALQDTAGDYLEEVVEHRGSTSLRLMVAKMALMYHQENIINTKREMV